MANANNNRYSQQENKEWNHEDAGADEEEDSLGSLVPGVDIVHQALVHSVGVVTVHTERATTLARLNSATRTLIKTVLLHKASYFGGCLCWLITTVLKYCQQNLTS